MSGVQDNQSHFAAVNAVADLGDQLVRHLMVCHMSPPEQHIGGVQHLVGQTLLRIVQRRQTDVQSRICLKEGLDASVDAVRVDVPAGRFLPFVAVLIPNGNVQLLLCHCFGLLYPF